MTAGGGIGGRRLARFDLGLYPSREARDNVRLGGLAEALGLATVWVTDSPVIWRELWVTAQLLAHLQRRGRRLLVRRGRLSEDAEATDPFAAQEPLFAHAVAASLHGRVGLGPRAGQPLRRLRSAATVRESTPRCARLAKCSSARPTVSEVRSWP